MAEPPGLIASEQLQQSSTAITYVKGPWEVNFSRFVRRAYQPSTCPSLAPLHRVGNKTVPRRSSSAAGTWLSSSSSSTASLKLLCCGGSDPATIITVCFKGKMLEQHFVSKLQFFRPLVSCIPDFPARGSRAILVSYKDSMNEIQKFALQFSTTYEADSFTTAVKESLNDATEVELPSTQIASEISSHSGFMCSSPYRVQEELGSSTGNQNPDQLPVLENEAHHLSFLKEIDDNHNADNGLASFPPSFTSFLTSCCSEVQQARKQSTIPQEIDLRSQIMRYMEDSTFLEMLIKVDGIIKELGGHKDQPKTLLGFYAYFYAFILCIFGVKTYAKPIWATDDVPCLF